MRLIACIFFLLLSSVNVFGQWEQTSGPSGGGVSDFASVNGKILAATFDLGNGIYASTDNGSSWHESGLQGMMLTKITAFKNTVLAATTYNSYNETDEIYRSTDGGDSWQSVKSVSNINGIRSICYFKNRWYFSAQGQKGGLFISVDDGVTWEQTKPASFNFSHAISMVSTDNVLIAATDVLGIPAMYHSSDGRSWIPSNNDSVSFAYCGSVSGKIIWLGVSGGVMYSTNEGNDWNHPGNRGIELSKRENFISLAVSGNHLVAVSSLNSIYYSWDGGNQWSKLSGNGLPVNASYFFSIYLRDTTYFLGSSSGIMLSHNDGIGWQYSSAGLRATSVSQLGTSGGKIFAATERGVSVTSDVGTVWRDPKTEKDLLDVPVLGFLNGHSRFYAFGSGIYTWNGFLWSQIDTNVITALTVGASERLFASRQTNDPIAGTGGIFFSDNLGAKWDSLLVFTNTFDTEFFFLPHCVTAHNSTVVAVRKAIAFQTFGSSYSIYRSSDNGITWQSSQVVNSPSFIDYADGSFYMGTYDAGLFQSSDDGITWIPIGFNAKSGVTSFVKVGASLFAAVIGNGNIADGIYFMENGGGWKYANGAIANISGPLATDGTFLYSGVPSVWRRRLNELGVNDKKIASQNQTLEFYPNPSRDILYLRLNTARPIDGTLRVSDEKGSIDMQQEIHQIGDGSIVRIIVTDFAEGIYFAKLIDNSGLVVGASQFLVMRK